MEELEKSQIQEKMTQISALEKENTPESQYRAIEIAEGIEDEKLRERTVKATASRLVFMLEEEGSTESLEEAEKIIADYFE